MYKMEPLPSTLINDKRNLKKSESIITIYTTSNIIIVYNLWNY